MEVEALQNLQDIQEQTSDYQSFGSKIHPSSQSRKISIGVMADPVANTIRGSKKGNGVIVPNRERSFSNERNFDGEKSKVEGVTASINMMQTGGPDGVKYSRITKSFYQRTPTSETILQANQASNLLVSTARLDKPDSDRVVGCVPAKSSVQLFSNQTSVLQSSYYNQNKVDGTGKRKVRKDGSTERVEEFTFTTAHEAFQSDKTKLQDKANTTENRTESLRMKLWEILGTPSAPKAQHLGSQTHNMDEESVVPKQHFDQNNDKVVKIIQNSDTIETDSENPDHTIKRPVTRSWSRKRASAKRQPTKSGPSSRDKQTYQERNVFNFVESRKERQSAFLDGASSMSMRKKSERSKSRIGPRKICFSENDNAGKPFQDTSKNDIPPHEGETFSIENKTRGLYGCLPGQYKECPQIEGIIQEKELYQSPTVNKKDQHEGLEALADENQQELTSNPVVENVADPEDNVQSPTFQLKTPTLNSSPSSTPEMEQKENGVNSSSSTERSYSLGVIRNLRTFQVLETDCDRLRTERLQDMEKLEDSPPRKAASFVKEKDAENDLSDSSSEEKKFQESQEGSSLLEEGSRERHAAEKKMLTLLPIKRLCTREGLKFNDCGPASPSSKGTGESDWIHEASDQNLEDGFARAVELFALELGKFSSKLKSVTSQKSSEILMSVAEEIHLQLQDVHSQIERDIGKLTSLSKSKRKRLEARFEDQQKQLRLIHKKFKEEVNLHLQDCRSTIQGLEADQLEIKGALDKQRASHRKLLSQVEEALEIQLNDAKRRITSVQELARGKLLQLKHVIAMCLKESILN